MKQKMVTLLMVILIAGLMSAVVIGSNNKEKQTSEDKIAELRDGDPIYYYGTTCPYCKVVQEWLDENKVSETINYTKKEVWSNQVNANELSRVAVSCGLNPTEIGVPFLFAEGQCLIGAPDIIAYFEGRLGIDATPLPEITEEKELSDETVN
jgi:glutaredoxin